LTALVRTSLLVICSLAACHDPTWNVGDRCDPKHLNYAYRDCNPNFTCDAVTRKCVRWTQCGGSDGDCPAGEVCLADSENALSHCTTNCWDPASNLALDNYCKTGYRCDTNGLCVAATGSCDPSSDQDCNGWLCDPSSRTCASPTPCAISSNDCGRYGCEGQYCYRSCANNDYCAQGASCGTDHSCQ
jgi:hypothetical protein